MVQAPDRECLLFALSERLTRVSSRRIFADLQRRGACHCRERKLRGHVWAEDLQGPGRRTFRSFADARREPKDYRVVRARCLRSQCQRVEFWGEPRRAQARSEYI